jgi:hypothetical protein
MRAPCARAWRPEQGGGGAGGWRSPADWKTFSDGVPGSVRKRPLKTHLPQCPVS